MAWRVRGGGGWNPSADFSAALNRKYDILEQNSDANLMKAMGGGMRGGSGGGSGGRGAGLSRITPAANAFAATAQQEADMINAQRMSILGLASPQQLGAGVGMGALTGAAANPNQSSAPWANGGMAPGQAGAPPLSQQQQSIANNLGFTDLQRNVMNANNAGANIGYIRFPGATPPAAVTSAVNQQEDFKQYVPGYAKGTARVPGKGDGTKDSVKAKLAPGEAVLNKAAADGMGRGLIAVMNKLGAKKMGMA